MLSYFECPANPAADPTLGLYKEVVCGSDEHESVLPAMVFGMVFYCIGFFVLTLWAAYKTPEMYMKLWFREVFKFMLSRWQPDVYFWGAVVMARNWLVACAGLVSGQGRVQLLYVVAMTVIYLSLAASWTPWRVPNLTHFDVTSSIVLAFIGIFGIVFLSILDEIEINQRFDQQDIVTAKKAQLSAFITCLMILIIAFCVLFGGLVVWCVRILIPDVSKRVALQNTEACNTLIADLAAALNDDFLKKVSALIRDGTMYEQQAVASILSKIRAAEGTVGGGLGETASFKQAEEKSGAETVISA